MAYDGTLVQDYLRRTHGTSLLTDREKHLDRHADGRGTRGGAPEAGGRR
jgi:hypothetical protein